ncbi:MAG TPA: tetratricopeptide repeat protein, partial [Prosthecobacter sp.]|nr:tetratricopeptide repeat protein [Prosthecobacter sp.]
MRELTEALAVEKIDLRVIDLFSPSFAHTLLDHVKAAVAPAQPDQRLALMIINLESRVEYNPELHQSGSPGLEFLATANLHRELFEAACPFPLVIWMTELLERAIVKQAPDLWQWRSHVFDLRTRERPVETFTAPDGRPLRSDDNRLHPDIRLQRLEDELAAYRKTGSRADEMRTLNAIGLARLDAGDAKLARHDFEEVLRIARELGNRRWEGAALGNLGNAYGGIGDAHKAIAYHEQALTVCREIGDKRWEGAAMGNIGNSHGDLGDARKAIEFYEKQLVITREIGDRLGEGNALSSLGLSHTDLGNAQKAIEFYEQGFEIHREIGSRLAEGQDLGN